MGQRTLRTALWTAAAFNAGASIVFAFASSLGSMVGLPQPVPRLYGVFIAMFVLLFSGAYAWLAWTPRIDRPVLALGAVGKFSAVVLALVFFSLGDLGPNALVAASGDLLFAGIFGWALLSDRRRELYSLHPRAPHL
jgi:hypothetical protein